MGIMVGVVVVVVVAVGVVVVVMASNAVGSAVDTSMTSVVMTST
jgi:hypothetical protein